VETRRPAAESVARGDVAKTRINARLYACDKLPHSIRPLLQNFNSTASAS
jgi:hypothetical protein